MHLVKSCRLYSKQHNRAKNSNKLTQRTNKYMHVNEILYEGNKKEILSNMQPQY